MKNWKKLTLGAATMGAAVLVLAGCSSGGKDSSGGSSGSSARAIHTYVTAPIQTLDNSLLTDTYSGEVVGNVNSGLMRIDKDGKAQPELAEKVEKSKDGLTYTFTLRDGLKWSNGDAITAKDFVYSWQRAVDPATASEYAYIMTPLKNADEINSGDNKDVKSLGVEAKDDKTLVVTLKAPTPYFESLTAMPVYLPLNQKFVEKQGKQFGTSAEKTLYSGPFKFTDEKNWNGSNNTFSIYKNKDYWDAKNVKSDEVQFQVIQDVQTAFNSYKQDKIDLASIGEPSLYKINKNDKNRQEIPEATTAYLEFNQSGKGATSPEAQKALANKSIRQALLLATNRKAYVDQLVPAYAVATGLTPAGMSKTPDGEDFAKYAAQDYSYDAAKAKELWNAGLKELGLSSLTLEFLTDDSTGAKDAATFFKQSWEKDLPGLTLNLKTVPFKQRLNDSSNGNFDIVNTLWGGDYSDPSTFLDLFTTGNPQNKGQFSNAAYDKAIDAAHGADVQDPEKLYADYKAAEAALFDEASIDPIYFRTTPYLVNPKYKGTIFNATGLDRDFKYAYIAK
ncbi:MAG: peptide ABC transporter substrate-binding protein [Streptococcaceae bacterium]|nr:peptide ABC transporter substrate-binding protein [Streptococcaceae bacterium]